MVGWLVTASTVLNQLSGSLLFHRKQWAPSQVFSYWRSQNSRQKSKLLLLKICQKSIKSLNIKQCTQQVAVEGVI